MKPITIIISIFIITLFFTACTKPQSGIETQPASSPQTEAETQVPNKTFTLEELAQYDGQDGRPAYLAVDGIVYDLSSVFQKGTHYKHLAGKDLSADFYTAHQKSEIQKYPIVGRLVE